MCEIRLSPQPALTLPPDAQPDIPSGFSVALSEHRKAVLDARRAPQEITHKNALESLPRLGLTRFHRASPVEERAEQPYTGTEWPERSAELHAVGAIVQ